MHGQARMPDSRTYFDPRAQPGPTRKRTAEDDPPGRKVKDELPSVLVREKKQKACSNCRRAKLKCIVQDGDTQCVRCITRKETCQFYPRGHDEDLQHTMANDLRALAMHMEHMTRAYQHMMNHLVAQGMPPIDPPLPDYKAPDHDYAALQGWNAERNRELGNKKRKGSDDELFPQFTGPEPSFMRPGDMHVGMGTLPNGPPDGQQNGGALTQTGPMLQAQSGVVPVLGGLVPFDASRPSNEASISPVDTGSFVAAPTSTSQGSVQSQVMGTPSLAGGAFGLLSGPRPNVSPVLPDDHDQFGASDPRPNIVKRGIISNVDATTLVDFFHSTLGPWLFGYRLEYGRFPYIPNGPCVITPFILSVLSFVSSERIPVMHKLQHALGHEVNQLLMNSPADSFIGTLDNPFGGASLASRDGGDPDDELDPELGIGPEEIVAACVLAMFTVDRDSASTIAASAFRWARGWIRWTSLAVPLPPTLGEVCGLLPIKRDATREDMARIWLLCYIVDGTEALQRDSPTLVHRDFGPYCEMLLSDTNNQNVPSHDVLLVFHARLVSYLRDWYTKRCSATTVGMVSDLGTATNATLDWWRRELDGYCLAPELMRPINLFWEFARMLVNRTTAKSIGDAQLARTPWTIGTEAALGFLEKCSQWPQADELSLIPPCYLNMTTLAGSVLVDAIKEKPQGTCHVRPAEAITLLNTVARMLEQGGVPDTHPARQQGKQLREFAAHLSAT